MSFDDLDQRPDPDLLLQQMQAAEQQQSALDTKRGRLKIFFGACAGVGKTYAMLSAAREKMEDGLDVVAGVVETHGRLETEELRKAIPQFPFIESLHRGITMREMDLEGLLKAKPALVLVDELAHTNAPGSLNPKRWMDVQQLLEVGIDVYSTLNVQHLESLNDIVASITAIRVKETVPDVFFDSADDITLVDIPSDELLERLQEGKVYITDMGKKRAAAHFFRRENLIALRELALRRTAERVDAQKDVFNSYMQQRRSSSDKLVVCIGAGDLSPRLLRATKRLASALRASWVGIYVENTRHYRLNDRAQRKLERNIRLAEQLGSHVDIVHGEDAARAIIDYAKKNNVTKIIAGKPSKSRWIEWFYGSLVDELIRLSGPIDVYVITGDEAAGEARQATGQKNYKDWKSYLYGLIGPVLTTAVIWPIEGLLSVDNILILYVISVVLTGVAYGRSVAVASALLSFIFYSVFFAPIRAMFLVDDYNDVIRLILLVLMALFAGSQTSMLHAQARFFRKKERMTSALYAMSKELAATREKAGLLTIITRHLEQSFDGMALLWMGSSPEKMERMSYLELTPDVKEEMVAHWVFKHHEPAGIGTNTMPSARGYYVPLLGSEGLIGVLGFVPRASDQATASDHWDFLDTFASLAAGALERALISELAEKNHIESEGERLRGKLLSIVSHDLRAPLAATRQLLGQLTDPNMQPYIDNPVIMLKSALLTVARMERMVSNLLTMTLLETGKLVLRPEVITLNQLIDQACLWLEEEGKNHIISRDVARDLPLLDVDPVLIEQVLVNLLHNAIHHSPAKTVIAIHARRSRKAFIKIFIDDEGDGLEPGTEEQVFDKLSPQHKRQKGVYGLGLGLAICRAIIQLHGGVIRAKNRDNGGVRIHLSLPIASIPSTHEDG